MINQDRKGSFESRVAVIQRDVRILIARRCSSKLLNNSREQQEAGESGEKSFGGGRGWEKIFPPGKVYNIE